MSLVLYIFVIVFAFLYPKSKKVSYCILILMWILYALNTYSGDYIAYEYGYSIIMLQNWGVEIGFHALMRISSFLGLSFSQFRMILATVYVLLLSKIVFRETNYSALALALILIVPFPFNVSVLRSGLAGMILLNAFPYLQVNSVKGKIKYTLVVIIATMFHRSALLFLIFLLGNHKLAYKKFGMIIVGAFIVSYLLNKTSILENAVRRFFPYEKVTRWFNAETTLHPNFTGIVIMVGIVISMVLLERSLFKKNIISINAEDNGYLIAVLQDNIFVLSLVFVPFVCFADSYMRLYYMLYPLLICISTRVIKDSGIRICKKTVKIRSELVAIFLLTLFIAWYMNHPYVGTKNEALSIFKYNSLIGYN